MEGVSTIVPGKHLVRLHASRLAAQIASERCACTSPVPTPLPPFKFFARLLRFGHFVERTRSTSEEFISRYLVVCCAVLRYTYVSKSVKLQSAV